MSENLKNPEALKAGALRIAEDIFRLIFFGFTKEEIDKEVDKIVQNYVKEVNK